MSEADRTEQGRRLAESLRRAAEIAEGDEGHEVRSGPRTLQRESRGFAEGAEAQRYLREHVCPNGDQPYGPFVPPKRHGVSLEEKAELVEFLPHHIALFRLLTPDRSLALGRFAIRLTEGQTVGRWWRGAWKIGAAIVVAAFAAARWGVDQIPLLKELANLWKGPGS